MKKPVIKLIVFDCYGPLLNEGYPNTAKALARRYGGDWRKIHEVMYHKLFNRAAVRSITQKQAWVHTVQELDLPISWKQLRDLHYSLMKIDKRAVALNKRLEKKGYTTVLLSKNTRSQFADVKKKFGLKKKFTHIINTWELGLPKASKKTIRALMKRFRVRADEMVYFDDQAGNLADPKSLGVHTILYKNYPQLVRELKRFVDI